MRHWQIVLLWLILVAVKQIEDEVPGEYFHNNAGYLVNEVAGLECGSNFVHIDRLLKYNFAGPDQRLFTEGIPETPRRSQTKDRIH
jgi:hypothetical protein